VRLERPVSLDPMNVRRAATAALSQLQAAGSPGASSPQHPALEVHPPPEGHDTWHLRIDGTDSFLRIFEKDGQSWLGFRQSKHDEAGEGTTQQIAERLASELCTHS